MKGTTLAIIVGILILVGTVSVVTLGNDGENSGEGSTFSAVRSQNGGAAKGDTVPALIFKDASGEDVALTSFEGTPVVVNSWATWCPFCVDEIPDFVELQREFGDDVVVIAVNRRESVDKSENFLRTLNVGAHDLVFLYDSRDQFYREIGGFSMPETLFADAKGNVVVHKRGFMDLREMREHTQKIIK